MVVVVLFMVSIAANLVGVLVSAGNLDVVIVVVVTLCSRAKCK